MPKKIKTTRSFTAAPATAWAWAFKSFVGDGKWILCRWSEPSSGILTDRMKQQSGGRVKPTSDAKAVRVVMLTAADYRALVRAAKGKAGRKGRKGK